MLLLRKESITCTGAHVDMSQSIILHDDDANDFNWSRVNASWLFRLFTWLGKSLTWMSCLWNLFLSIIMSWEVEPLFCATATILQSRKTPSRSRVSSLIKGLSWAQRTFSWHFSWTDGQSLLIMDVTTTFGTSRAGKYGLRTKHDFFICLTQILNFWI